MKKSEVTWTLKEIKQAWLSLHKHLCPKLPKPWENLLAIGFRTELQLIQLEKRKKK